MSETNVWMLWDCVDCGQKQIPCSPKHRVCPNCRHPRTFIEFDQAYLPGTDATWDEQGHADRVITGAELARFQTLGASWFCTNCKGDNYDDEPSCFHCQATRKASDAELREALDYKTYQAYMDGDRGATADLVQQFGEYAGMRAAQGESFAMNGNPEGQLARAQAGRSAFQSEMGKESHPARPDWDDGDLPSTIESLGSMPPTESKAKAHKRALVYKLVALAVGVFCFIAAASAGIYYWATRIKVITGEVKSVHWKRTVQEERWTPVTRGQWESELSERAEIPPKNGKGERAGIQILSCEDKHHHYVQYVCGTKQVSCTHMQSYTETYSCTEQQSYQQSYSCSRSESYSCGESCSTSRGANGMATRTCSPKICTRSVSDTCTRTAYRSVPATCTRHLSRPIHSSDTVDKMCDRSIEASWCSHATQEWQPSEKHVKEGDKHPAIWPPSNLDPLEREKRSEEYSAVVGYTWKGKPFSQTKKPNASEFEKYQMGTDIIFEVSNINKVRRVYGPGEAPRK